MKTIKGGIAAPIGFKAGAVHCGLKKRGLDLGLIYSVVPATAQGLFTTNRAKAAPVKISKAHLSDNQAQAVLVNSATANSSTGKKGFQDALRILGVASSMLNIEKRLLLLASTGIIGRPLPVERIVKAMPKLVSKLNRNGGGNFARAIITSDKSSKEMAVRFKIGRRQVRIGATVKGAGMISPNLATMLAFFTTDADLTQAALVKALKTSVRRSFNCVTIDGDMSTNDTVIILANGLAKNPRLSFDSPGFKVFQSALDQVAMALAKLMVKGGEGVSKFIEITVKGARSLPDANLAARKVANSPLVKTMIGGADPNWGRIIAALGASGAQFKESKVDLWFGNSLVLRNGALSKRGLTKSRKALSNKDVKITIDLKIGKAKASVWTGDLTEEYIRINRSYGWKR